MVVYGTLVWSTRELEIILMFLGQLGCEALNFLLKRLIKEERPKEMFGNGYGMPSSHAQFVTYFSLSLSLFLLLRHHSPPGGGGVGIEIRVALSGLALAGAALVSWSRVYLNYHTPRQVLVGCVAGLVSALLWFTATTFLRYVGLLGWALESPVARLLRIRDLVINEDLCQAGWEKWERGRMNGNKAKHS